MKANEPNGFPQIDPAWLAERAREIRTCILCGREPAGLWLFKPTAAFADELGVPREAICVYALCRDHVVQPGVFERCAQPLGHEARYNT